MKTLNLFVLVLVAFVLAGCSNAAEEACSAAIEERARFVTRWHDGERFERKSVQLYNKHAGADLDTYGDGPSAVVQAVLLRHSEMLSSGNTQTDRNVYVLHGDAIDFQNGFGAWTRYNYACAIDTSGSQPEVLHLGVWDD